MPDFTPLEAPAHKAQSLPVNLPGKLLGRDTVLAQIYQQLKSNHPVLVYGAAGMGKTAVAATLASAYTELPGGVLWLTVDDSSLEELIARVGRAYDVPEIKGSDTPLGMVGAVASTLTASKPLVVLDGLHNPQATADFVNRCAAGLPVMLVSKDRLDGPWAALELHQLDEAPAMALLKQQAGLEDRADVDEQIDELASILDYTPLALVVAAGTMRLAKQSPADYLTAFEQIPASGATPQLLALTVGFRSLSNALQGILLMLGATFRGEASAELLSLMSGAPVDTVQQVMTMLANSSFVERFSRYDAPYYRLHDLMHGFTQTWLRGAQRLDGLQHKVRDTVVDYVKKYSGNDPAAQDKLATEMDTIMAVARWSAEQGDRDVVNQLIVSLRQAGDFVNERGYVYELLNLRKLASSITTAFPANPAPVVPPPAPMAVPASSAPEDVIEALDDEEDEEEAAPTSLPRATVGLFDTLADFEEEAFEEEAFDLDEDELYDEEEDIVESDSSAVRAVEEAAAADGLPALSPLEAQLRQARQQNDLARQIEVLQQIAELHRQQNRDTEAISAYTELLTAYESREDNQGILRTLDTLSSLMVKTENSGAAVMYATRGINIADELGDDELAMHLLATQGDARQQLGESAEAAHAYQRALDIARRLGNDQSEAVLLFKLGAAQLDNNDARSAATTWEQALTLFRAQGKRAYEGRVLGGLGTAYGEIGRWEEAINFHKSALYIAREVKDRYEEALQLGNLGDAAVQANQLGEAVLRYRQALHLAFESGNREAMVSGLVDLLLLLVESRRPRNSAELLINEALRQEPNDRDVNRLKERIASEKRLAEADGVELIPVVGTAQDYAANAYQLLDM